MASDNSTGTLRAHRSAQVRLALWVLGLIALIELILAAIALAPRFVSGLRAGSSPFQSQVEASSLPNSPTPSQLTTPRSTVSLPVNQQTADTVLGNSPVNAPVINSTLKQILTDQKVEKPLRQPPADAAVNGEAPLKIVNARLSDTEDGSKKLQVAIKANSQEQIDSAQEKVQVYFYDQDGDEIVPSKAQVTSKWLNWQSGEPQLVEVTYLPESVDPGVKFAGYVIAVYYKGDLQDCRAQPPRLQKLFEPNYYIGTEE